MGSHQHWRGAHWPCLDCRRRSRTDGGAGRAPDPHRSLREQNLRTQCCRSLAEHPVKKYFDAGLMVTLSTDDPAMFGTSLVKEYELLRREFGFTDEQLRELARNSFEASFLPAEKKLALLKQVDSY